MATGARVAGSVFLSSAGQFASGVWLSMQRTKLTRTIGSGGDTVDQLFCEDALKGCRNFKVLWAVGCRTRRQ